MARRNSKGRKRSHKHARGGLYGVQLDKAVMTPTGGSWLRWRRRRTSRIRPVA